MKQVTENRMATIDEDRAPDPRNVSRRREWSVERNRLVEVRRNHEERDGFGDHVGGVVRGRPSWPADARSIGEIRREGLVGCPVICPRRIDVDGYVVAVPGQVISWADAVAWGVVDA